MTIEDKIELEIILTLLHKLLVPDNFDEIKYFLSNKSVFKNQRFASNVVTHILKLEELKSKSPFDENYIKELRELRDKLLGVFDKENLNDPMSLGYIIQSYNFKTKEDLTIQGKQLMKMEKDFISSLILQINQRIQEITKIHSRDFEIIMAELFQEIGNYKIDLTKKTRDGGYDFLAISNENNSKLLVECKRNRLDRPIGISIIQRFMFILIKNKIKKGMLITTSRLTRDAQEEIYYKDYTIDYADSIEIMEWIKKYEENTIHQL